MDDKRINFRQINMPTFPKGTNLSFKPLFGSQIDESRQYLLDNIWNAKDDNRKILTALNTLTFYFTKIQSKPLSKNFSFYMVFKGFTPGIYHTWLEVLQLITNF